MTRFLFFGLITMSFLSGQAKARSIDTIKTSSSQMLSLSLNTGVANQKISFVSSFSGWDPDQFVLSEVRKGYYTLSIPSPWVSEFYYKFVVDGKWSYDPENPNREPDGYGGYNSIYETGFKESTMFVSPKPNLAWLKKEHKLSSGKAGLRSITVLIPPFTSKASLPTVYFNDGNDYLNFAYVKNFLANYYARTGQALIAVMVPPVSRETEYGAWKKNSMDSFLVDKVVPFVELTYATGSTPAKRMIVGPSLGGLSSARTGFVTKAFGFVASQSGSFWYIENDLEQLIRDRVNTPKMYLTYGFYEADGIVDSNKKIKSLLKANEIPFEMLETPTTHNWMSWRNQLESLFDWFIQNQ